MFCFFVGISTAYKFLAGIIKIATKLWVGGCCEKPNQEKPKHTPTSIKTAVLVRF